MIRVTAQMTPVASLADEEAWQAREAYPEIRSAGGPVFGVAREREEGGWEIQPHFSGTEPQDARDSMAAIFRRRAHAAEQAGDQAAVEECLAAAERLDWETIDEMTVLGERYRVVRAESFIRSGPEGPEPPRPSDPDPARPGESHRVPDPTDGFVIDPLTATGLSEGMLKVELLSLVPREGSVPPGVRADALRAAQTHPGGVLLPPAFMTAEEKDGDWVPHTPGTSTTPQAARDALTMYLRVLAPVVEKLGRAEREEYARAADLLDERRGADVEFAGRHLRVVRVERLVRIGPDGPEGPRPSDVSTQPPVSLHVQQLKEQGLWDEEDDSAEPEPSEEMKEFHRLWEKERLRRERRNADG